VDSVKTATVRDLRYRFSEIEERLKRGEEVAIRKRSRIVAELVPYTDYPDFAARQKEIFGERVMPLTFAELVGWDSGGR
jgi:antitoxin (DNA-binding transcriptional repressor) of toxin-antitoxin stability system